METAYRRLRKSIAHVASYQLTEHENKARCRYSI